MIIRALNKQTTVMKKCKMYKMPHAFGKQKLKNVDQYLLPGKQKYLKQIIS